MGVTFYIPCLNSAKTIDLCITSIKKQSKRPHGIVLVDGGSDDETLKIAAASKIRILRQEKKGLANARNLAIRDCGTDIIAFVDSDCVLDRRWLEEAAKKLDNAVGVCGRLDEKYSGYCDRWRAYHLSQHWGDKIIEPDFLFGSNSLFRAAALKELGYDERFLTNYEDVDVSRRLKEKGYKILYEPIAKGIHLRKDSLKTLLRTARNWSFHSYPLPDSFTNLLLRLFIFNPHLSVNFFFKEVLGLRFGLMPITFASFFYNEFFDIKYYIFEKAMN